MKKIKINPNKISKEEIKLIVDYFQKEKVVAYPTDTVYGLGCLARDKKAIEKVYKIKKRDKSSPLLILVSSISMLKKYCYLSQEQNKYLKKIWPGPVSVILRSKGVLAKELSGGNNNIAVRLPKNDFLIKIVKRVGDPIVSTSLNISGKKTLNSLENLEKYFKTAKPDLVLDAGAIQNSKVSRLIDLRDTDKIKILRK